MQVREVDAVQFLILVVAGEDELLAPGSRVDVALEALGANLFHHALHRRVDAADADVRRVQIGLQHAVAREPDGVHHAVGADGDDPGHVLQRHDRGAKPSSA